MRQVNRLPYAYLHESIKNIDRLSTRVCQYLQIDPKQHSLHVLPRQQEIIVIVEEPILASQLKYQQKEILSDLNRSFLSEFKTIKIKLSPPKMVRVAKKKPAKPLTIEITSLLASVREDLESN